MCSFLDDILLLGSNLLPSTPRLQELVSFQHSLLNCFWKSIRANPSDDILLLGSNLLPSTPRLQELVSFQQEPHFSRWIAGKTMQSFSCQRKPRKCVFVLTSDFSTLADKPTCGITLVEEVHTD
ncbi:unnamed protein product [Malus baccata var. baccata]